MALLLRWLELMSDEAALDLYMELYRTPDIDLILLEALRDSHSPSIFSARPWWPANIASRSILPDASEQLVDPFGN